MSIINTALIGKLKKTKADLEDVLTLSNETIYEPTADYHPATKKYVDDLISLIANIETGSFSTTTTTSSINTKLVPTASLSDSRIFEIYIGMQDTVTNEVQTHKLFILHNDTDLHISQYPLLYTGDAPLANFSAIIIGSDISLTITAASTNLCNVSFVSIPIKSFEELSLTETTNVTPLYATSASSRRFMEYIIQIQDISTDEYEKMTIKAIYDGTNVVYSTSDNTYTGSGSLANIYPIIDGGNMVLTTEAASSNQTLYKVEDQYFNTTWETESGIGKQTLLVAESEETNVAYWKVRVSDTVAGEYQYTTIMAVEDGSNVSMIVAEDLWTGSGPIVEFQAVINSTNIELEATPVSSTNSIDYEILPRYIEV